MTGGPLFRSARVRSIREGERRISAVASTEALDAHGTIIRANWDLRRFAANPVLLWGNDDHALPVGLCSNVRVEGGELLFDAIFDDATEFDQQVWEKYRRGVLRGFSVLFNPLERRTVDRDGQQVIEYTRSELMAITCAPVPPNPQALQRSAGDEQRHTMKNNQKNNGANRSAVRLLVDGYPQMFPGELRSWALGESLEVVQSFIHAGGHQAANTNASRADEEKLDRILGIMPERSGKIGFEFDPVRGVRVFNTPTPGQIRAARGF